jgi:hypothetical protein
MASCSIPYIFGAIPLYCKNENNEIVPYHEGGKFENNTVQADLFAIQKGKNSWMVLLEQISQRKKSRSSSTSTFL